VHNQIAQFLERVFFQAVNQNMPGDTQKLGSLGPIAAAALEGNFYGLPFELPKRIALFREIEYAFVADRRTTNPQRKVCNIEHIVCSVANLPLQGCEILFQILCQPQRKFLTTRFF